VSNVHIFTRPHQPATRFFVQLFEGEKHWIRCKPRSLVRCRKCKKLRWAKNCTVQVYYDDVPAWCRPGKGCKA
jgi:hypothetical protein